MEAKTHANLSQRFQAKFPLLFTHANEAGRQCAGAVFEFLQSEIEAAERRRTEEVVKWLEAIPENGVDVSGEIEVAGMIARAARRHFLTNPER